MTIAAPYAAKADERVIASKSFDLTARLPSVLDGHVKVLH